MNAPAPLSGTTTSAQPPSRWRRFWRRLAVSLQFWLLLGGGVGLVASLAQGLWWPLEDLAVFRVQWTLALLAGGALALLRRSWWWAGFGAAAAVWPVVQLASMYVGPPAPVGGGERVPLRVLFSNVLTDNRAFGELRAYIERESPDVVVLAEVDQGWLDGLAALRTVYPYWVSRPRDDNLGIALLSKSPPLDAVLEPLAEGAGPAIRARVRPAGSQRAVTIIGVHLFPPVSTFMARERDRQAARLAVRARAAGASVVVVGDLNMGDGAPAFGRLLEAGGLRDTRHGFGVQASWPALLPPLVIPIDHALVSPDIEVRGRVVGPDVGSDHYPILLDLGVPR